MGIRVYIDKTNRICRYPDDVTPAAGNDYELSWYDEATLNDAMQVRAAAERAESRAHARIAAKLQKEQRATPASSGTRLPPVRHLPSEAH